MKQKKNFFFIFMDQQSINTVIFLFLDIYINKCQQIQYIVNICFIAQSCPSVSI